MQTESNSYGRKGVDWWLVMIYILLVTFGWMNIYAANFNPETQVFFSVDAEYFKQLIWIGITALSAGIIMLIDSKFYVNASILLYVISMALLAVVLVVGKEVNGARSWFEVGFIRFQPAEVAKMSTALMVARIMSRYGFTFSLANSCKLGLVLMLPVLFILLQNDTGSALVYFVLLIPMYREGLSPQVLVVGMVGVVAAISSFLVESVYVQGVMLLLFAVAAFVAGLRRDLWVALLLCAASVGAMVMFFYVTGHDFMRWEYSLLGGTAVMSVFLLIRSFIKRLPVVRTMLVLLWVGMVASSATDYAFDNILSPHQRTRINVLFGVEEDLLGAGYNVNQSKIAIGSGGFAGKGFLQGTQTKFDFVPEQTTDFIFCTIGEEWGFVGSICVVALFAAFVVRMIVVAERQHSVFSRVYGYCVASVFFFHFAINISMTIGLAPVIGIPLPFFSYGGSSLWGFSILLFIFIKLDTNREELIR